jgi:hypothetical protein
MIALIVFVFIVFLFIAALIYIFYSSPPVINESFETSDDCSGQQIIKEDDSTYSFKEQKFKSYDEFRSFFFRNYPSCNLPTIINRCEIVAKDELILEKERIIEPPDNEYFDEEDCDCESDDEEEEEKVARAPTNSKAELPKKQELSQQPNKKLIEKYSEKYEPNPKILSPYGFTYMPNTLWSVPQHRPPVCIPQEKVEPRPIVVQSKYSDVLEFTGLGSILPRFDYKENYNYSVEELKNIANQKRFNSNYYYPGYYTNSPQKIEDLI